MTRIIRQASWIVCILAGCATVQARADSRPTEKGDRSILSEAHAALEAGDAERALTLLKTRGLNIDRAERRSIEGRAHLLSGELVLARRKLRTALRLRSHHATDHYWLGRVHQAGGAPALAAKSYHAAWQNGMETADLHRRWAESLRDSGRVLGELRQLEWDHPEADPPRPGDFVDDGCVIGTVHRDDRRLLIAPRDSALCQIHKALILDPNRGAILLLCGELWAAAEHHRRAVDRFEQAAGRLEAEPLARCHRQWANSSLALGDFDGYLKHMRKGMQLSGGVVEAELARCYDRAAHESANRGDLQRQIRYLLFAAELKSDVDRFLRLSDALILAHRTPDAAAYLQQALDHKPTRKQRRAIQQRLIRTTYLASPQ